MFGMMKLNLELSGDVIVLLYFFNSLWSLNLFY